MSRQRCRNRADEPCGPPALQLTPDASSVQQAVVTFQVTYGDVVRTAEHRVSNRIPLLDEIYINGLLELNRYPLYFAVWP